MLTPFARAPILVIAPPRAQRLRAEIRATGAVYAANTRRALGLSSSVHRGLASARFEAAVLLVPMDLDRLKGRDIARLIGRWRGAKRRIAARRIGLEAGAPLILPRRFYPKALAIEGDSGLKTWVRQLASTDLSRVSLPSAAFDVDTARDLKSARRFGKPRVD